MNAIANRLADPTMQNRLTHIAGRFGDDAGDVQQTMALHLIEKATADPTFADQRLGYLVKAAAWNARHYHRDGRVYDRYVECEPMIVDEDGHVISGLDEMWPAPGLSPEQAVIQSEELAELSRQLSRLPAKQRQVALLLAAGYSPSEIADELRMSRSSVAHLAKRMRQALSNL